MEIHFLGCQYRYRFTVPARHRAGQGADRLRDVPGWAARRDAQPGAARIRPASLDAIILTHAHLDHCGLIPHIVAEGFNGPIYATRGTIELASLVLRDSGKLQEEFAKRHRHWP